MPIRKTESRIPANFEAKDLGEAFVSSNGKFSVVSFITNPLVINRKNTYVGLVTDNSLAASIETIEWIFSIDNQEPIKKTTLFSETTYIPSNTGNLNLTIKLMGAGNVELESLKISQQIVHSHQNVEILIKNGQDEIGPSIGNPEVVRELVNDYSLYYQGVKLKKPESGEGFKQMVFRMVYDGVLQCNNEKREKHLEDVAKAINGNTRDFADLINIGIGVAKVRVPTLAMFLPKTVGSTDTYIPIIEIQKKNPKKIIQYQKFCENIAALDEESRVDLFNLTRFPKSCIIVCGIILEGLQDHYFNNVNFNDVLMSGTRSDWIIENYSGGGRYVANPSVERFIHELPNSKLPSLFPEHYEAKFELGLPLSLLGRKFNEIAKKAKYKNESFSLIDLTIEGKPVYLGHNDKITKYIASTAKIGILFAALWLRKTVRENAQGVDAIDGKDLLNKLTKKWKNTTKPFPNKFKNGKLSKYSIGPSFTWPPCLDEKIVLKDIKITVNDIVRNAGIFELKKIFEVTKLNDDWQIDFTSDRNYEENNRVASASDYLEAMNKKSIIDISKLGFRDRLELMIGFSNNNAAGSCCIALGFQFLNSCFEKAGFYDRTSGGIWISKAYSAGEDDSSFQGGTKQAGTAETMSKLMALAAMKQLYDEKISNDFLLLTDVFDYRIHYESYIGNALKNNRLNIKRICGKPGDDVGLNSDVAYVEEQRNKLLKYVIACPQFANTEVLESLSVELANAIAEVHI